MILGFQMDANNRATEENSDLDAEGQPNNLIWEAPTRWNARRKKRTTARELLTLDASILRAVSLGAESPVITPYRPSTKWLFRQWRGTVLPPVLGLMIASLAISLSFALTVRLGALGSCTWPLFSVPDPTNPIIQRLLPLNQLWTQQFTLTTFIITFFLGQAYTYWRKSYRLCRSLQG